MPAARLPFAMHELVRTAFTGQFVLAVVARNDVITIGAAQPVPAILHADDDVAEGVAITIDRDVDGACRLR